MTDKRSKSAEFDHEFLPGRQEDCEQKRDENLSIVESQDEQVLPRLLPGLPNEIVLEEIVPKLSWATIRTLLLISRSWRQAIRNREVYDARVRSHSNETLLVFNHKFRADETDVATDQLFLYSMREKSWIQLPPLPPPHRRLPDNSRFISLDGKIYVLGGSTECHNSEDSQSDTEDSWPDISLLEVYVFDLAGQREWKQCADMLEPRFDHLCGVIDGKIYVFGRHTYELEHIQVYDPTENAWSVLLSPSMEMMEFGCTCNVVTIGEEFFLDISTTSGMEAVWDAEIYHPGKDEWRHDQKNQFFQKGGLFTSHGKLHRMTPFGIDVYLVDVNRWARVHSIGCGIPYREGGEATAKILVILATENDELFVLAQTFKFGACLFEGQGFGNNGEQIVWEKLSCPFPYEKDLNHDNIHSFVCITQI